MARAKKTTAEAAPEPLAEQAPGTLDVLSDAPYNPRRISDPARAGLRRSLVEFGDISGITYNFRTGNLVSGHQRRAELATLDPGKIVWGEWSNTELGRERWGSVVVTGGASFRVRGVDWSAAKEKAANVAANSQAISGEFTEELQGLLDELEGEDPGLFADLRFDDLRVDIPEPDGGGSPSDDPGEAGGTYKEQYGVIVICSNPAEQEKVYETLRTQGYTVKVVTT